MLNFLNETVWSAVAWIVSRAPVRNLLIRIAQRRPYIHLKSRDGESEYMGRWWLFNPYPWPSGSPRSWFWERMPSIRIHHIKRRDEDRHHHDHPWNARTIILKGCYREVREVVPRTEKDLAYDQVLYRHCGDTASLRFGEYHTIDGVAEGGAWTLFITWSYQGSWGFKVGDKKVPWREYLGVEDAPQFKRKHDSAPRGGL